MIGTPNCIYETPCGWCSKWDKSCDKKQPTRKNDDKIWEDTAMQDAEIKQALICCQSEYNRDCQNCPYQKYKTRSISSVTCSSRLRHDLLDFINRQEIKLQDLESYNNEIFDSYTSVVWHRDEQIKAAIKEFASRLKATAMQKFDWNEYIEVEEIDNLVKEMTN